MQIKYFFTLIILFLIFIIISAVRIYAQPKIFINEFLIDPTPQQVEIINTGTESIDISGWYIDDNGGSTYYTIAPLSIVYPNACLVFSGDFNFNKSSPDMIRLFNSSFPPTDIKAQLIDSFSYKASSGSGIAYFRLPDGENNWTTGAANLGKYNSTGQSCLFVPISSPTPTPTTLLPTPTENLINPTLTPLISTPTSVPMISYINIFLSEVMVNPTNGENEWVEIYNDNDFFVFLSNWYIDDRENAGSSPKIFSLEIPAKSYAVFDLSTSMFNNTGDNVRLLDFNKNLKDSFEYFSSIQGKTYGRISFENDEFCLQEPSKNQLNNVCLNPTATPYPTPTKTPTPIKTPTPTPTPNNLSVTTVNNTLINQLKNTKNVQKTLNQPVNSAFGIQENDENVLGASTQIKNKMNKPLLNSLSFSSFSYSLLSIVSIVLKMKFTRRKL